jgi:hypothetical protein
MRYRRAQKNYARARFSLTANRRKKWEIKKFHLESNPGKCSNFSVSRITHRGAQDTYTPVSPKKVSTQKM